MSSSSCTGQTRTEGQKRSRTVAALTPSQLARKRAHDRAAQRVRRTKTKEHIEHLQRELEQRRRGCDEEVWRLMHLNNALQDEVRFLKMSIRNSSSNQQLVNIGVMSDKYTGPPSFDAGALDGCQHWYRPCPPRDVALLRNTTVNFMTYGGKGLTLSVARPIGSPFQDFTDTGDRRGKEDRNQAYVHAKHTYDQGKMQVNCEPQKWTNIEFDMVQPSNWPTNFMVDDRKTGFSTFHAKTYGSQPSQLTNKACIGDYDGHSTMNYDASRA